MEIEDKVRELLEKEINEKPTLDYKVMDYDLSSDKKFEVVKDVIAMLNSEEAYDKDKFIFLGITDRSTFYIKGLEKEMRDDNEYQQIFNYINPRPNIEAGKIDIEDKIIGYIFISKSNKERPYAIAKKNAKYSQGASFIRKGSMNVPLDDQIREKLILAKYDKNPSLYNPLYKDIMTRNEVKNKLNYTDENTSGKVQIDPSNNNGLYTIGSGLFEFKLKFQVANNNLARIYNDYDLQVALLEGKASLFNGKTIQLKFEKLNFTSRTRDYQVGDLAIIINKMGKLALIIFKTIESKSHGSKADKLEFQWKILDRVSIRE